MTKVSIIIPNYNNSAYLPSCLESALSQTLKDIEIIVVDDCSTDGSMDIINAFSARDGRIKTIKMPKNSGVGAARNTGLNAATGEFVMFLDSDDCLFTNSAESLLGAATANHADLVVGRYSYVNDDFDWNISVALGSIGGHGMTSSDDMRKFIRMVDFGVTPVVCWGKLFRRRVLGDLRFSTDIYPNEDVDFMLRAYSKLVGHIAVVSDVPVVFYRRSKNSVILSGLNDKFINGWRKAILSANKYIAAESARQKSEEFDKYRRFFGRYVFVMLQSMMVTPAKGDIGRDFDRAVRDIYMAGVFAEADITPRIKFGLKLYVSGLRQLSRRFLVFNLSTIGRL
ncbi:MAG: glycosyltransferase [Rickettsiales bacterium]|jgi:glycosyltransferase involved in cell wall biosynthesis|nr:glycosyltransferase [Rickettsiales bacterium]